jgi:predicted YcjX-like family ATPase
MFPGDLPADLDAAAGARGDVFHGLATSNHADADYRFLRFRPPKLTYQAGQVPALPHIRLDRALQFLLGDRLA